MKSVQPLVLMLLLAACFSTAYAARTEAPVVDLSAKDQQFASESQNIQGLEVDRGEPAAAKTTTHQDEPIDQRVLRLERQVSNLTEMNLASKLEKIQQDQQQLQGQLEVQNHDLAQMKEQLRNFYQDLDQRLNKLQPDIRSGEVTKRAMTADTNLDSKKQATNQDSSKTKELETYEVAFNLLNKKDYDKAIEGFRSFVKSYPDSNYTPNAHYWMGEIYYLKGKPNQANTEFQTIITSYPDNPKVADAMLKVALIAMDAGNYTKAKQHLIKVQKQFPGTTAAKVASLRLKEIKQEK